MSFQTSSRVALYKIPCTGKYVTNIEVKRKNQKEHREKCSKKYKKYVGCKLIDATNILASIQQTQYLASKHTKKIHVFLESTSTTLATLLTPY